MRRAELLDAGHAHVLAAAAFPPAICAGTI